MPSVGMRRTTRVFGVVKRVDGARVLRSGRRLWPDSNDGVKLRRLLDKDDWYSLMKNTSKRNGQNYKSKASTTGFKSYRSAREDVNPKVLDNAIDDLTEIKCYSKKRKPVKAEGVDDKGRVDMMFGTVYSRKRKRLDKGIVLNYSKNTMYGIQYSRRRRRRMSDSGCLPELVIVIDSSFRMQGSLEHALCLVLGYMKKTGLRKSHLTEFLPQMIPRFYPYQGLNFLPDAPASTKGVCKFFGTRQNTPLFSVDYTAVPLCFVYMHRALLVRTMLLSFVFVNKYLSLLSNGAQMIESEEVQPMEEYETHDEMVVFHTCGSNNKDMLHPSVRASKLAGRNFQNRSGQNAHSFRKRRSSLRRCRAKNLSLGLQKTTLVTSRKNDIPFVFIASRNKTRTSPRLSSSTNTNEMNSVVLESSQDMDSISCFANILVIESDRCCREEGASIMLEFSSSREWLLVIRKDGTIRYTHKAENLMKPCSCNRLTLAIMWTGDDTWRLEFCDRQDWSIFKELYKECANRNASAPNVRVIPVPGVSEVSGYKDDGGVPFHRPVSYISVNGDEISRAMAKSTAIYDMDSEDEEWLKKFDDEPHDYLSENNFELMIDGFEKTLFIGLDDYSEEKVVASLGHLGRREVVEAVYRYWMRKRKRRKAPLIKVFQGHHAVKKAPVVLKPLLRKRRSFKRQSSQQFGRGKQTSLLQAEQYALEECSAALKVDEAKAVASRCVEAAIVKRQRAQILMENADLSAYKAVVACRIAEAARVSESSEAAASEFLD